MTLIDEKKLDRLQSTARLVAIVILGILLALIAFSAFRLSQINGKIQAKQRQLDEQSTSLEALRAEGTKLEEANRKLEQRRKNLSELIGAMDSTVVRRAIQEKPQTTDTVQSIYPHIRRSSDEDEMRRIRARAAKIAGRLEAAGFLMLRVQVVDPERSPKGSQVRFFHGGDVEERDVAAIVKVLEEAGVEAKPNPLPHLADTVPKRQYEVWFGEDFPP